MQYIYCKHKLCWKRLVCIPKHSCITTIFRVNFYLFSQKAAMTVNRLKNGNGNLPSDIYLACFFLPNSLWPGSYTEDFLIKLNKRRLFRLNQCIQTYRHNAFFSFGNGLVQLRVHQAIVRRVSCQQEVPSSPLSVRV